MNRPLVSAICVTENRVHFLQCAVTCFLQQDYPAIELIIAYPSHDLATANYVRTLDHAAIKALEVPANVTLGEKRNFAIASASGDYFCNWDDDDWYHPTRIREQITTLLQKGKEACTLHQVILYNGHDAFLSFKRPWEQTLLCARHVLNGVVRYGSLDKGEDSVLVTRLIHNDQMAYHFNPLLYVYVYHGQNVSQEEHWMENIFQYGVKLPADANGFVEKMLAEPVNASMWSSHLKSILEKKVQ